MKAKEITIVVTEAQLHDILKGLDLEISQLRYLARNECNEVIANSYKQDAIEIEELRERLSEE